MAAKEDYPDGPNILSPLIDGVAVDVSAADQDLTHVSRALRVGVAGDVKVKTWAGTDLVIPAVQVGETVPIRVTKIYKVGTAATGIVALW